jgi:hypothetical protein
MPAASVVEDQHSGKTTVWIRSSAGRMDGDGDRAGLLEQPAISARAKRPHPADETPRSRTGQTGERANGSIVS